MSDPDHVALIRSGVVNWNQWRQENPCVSPDLSGAELKGSDLNEADLHGADLSKAELQWSSLMSADLRGVNLADARLMGVDATRASFSNSDLDGVMINDARGWYADFGDCKMRNAYLWGTDFREANFSGADLTGANLRNTQLVMTKFCGTVLDNAKVYGIAAWDIDLRPKSQSNLLISAPNDPILVTVDDLEVAQFIYLLLNNSRLRTVIDTVTSKTVLILGSFSESQKPILDAVRDALRCRNLVPILFDFKGPDSKDLTGTVETLARMAKFIIADLTDPSSIPHEMATLVPHLRTTPVLPLRLAGSAGYRMFEDYQQSYDWVLNTHEYTDSRSLTSALPEIIAPAEALADKFRLRTVRKS
ncbi:MAG TPA: pentapeptide repeat-containing protein [Acetobacteraceae bacterium]|jgi:uncharacterized protein YjbI with pentapeptide repeats|nr:pentapeptide repeat-containing protein [Acetobacteraceae bacterium]